MILQTKVAGLAIAGLLSVTGGAFAATGHVPNVVKDGVKAIVTTTGSSAGSVYGEDGGAAGNQYGDDHGAEVREIARDKDATGTMTLPDGDEVENHGQAVRQAASDNEHESEMTPPAATQGTTTTGHQTGEHSDHDGAGMGSSSGMRGHDD